MQNHFRVQISNLSLKFMTFEVGVTAQQVKPSLGIPTTCTGVFGIEFCFYFPSSFLLICLRGRTDSQSTSAPAAHVWDLDANPDFWLCPSPVWLLLPSGVWTGGWKISSSPRQPLSLPLSLTSFPLPIPLSAPLHVSLSFFVLQINK